MEQAFSRLDLSFWAKGQISTFSSVFNIEIGILAQADCSS
jgi:hypothetical protein